MESHDYELAIQSFEHAQGILGDRTNQPPLVVSLVKFILPNGLLDCNAIFRRFLDGSLMTSQSRFDSIFVRPFTQRALQRKRASFYLGSWTLWMGMTT